MAISKISNWKISGILTISFTATNSNAFGSQLRFCIKSRNTGVRNTVIMVISVLENFRYSPVSVGK